MLYSSGALNYGQAKVVQDSQYEGIKIAHITYVVWLGFLELCLCEVNLPNRLLMTYVQNDPKSKFAYSNGYDCVNICIFDPILVKPKCVLMM